MHGKAYMQALLLQSLFEMAYNDEQMRGDVMLEKNILEDVLEIACSTTGDLQKFLKKSITVPEYPC